MTVSSHEALRPPSIRIVRTDKQDETCERYHVECVLLERTRLFGVSTIYADEHAVFTSGRSSDADLLVIAVTIRNPGTIIQGMGIPDGRPIPSHELLAEAKRRTDETRRGRHGDIYECAISALRTFNLPVLYEDWKRIVEDRRRLDYETGRMSVTSMRDSIPPLASSVCSSAPPPATREPSGWVGGGVRRPERPRFK